MGVGVQFGSFLIYIDSVKKEKILDWFNNKLKYITYTIIHIGIIVKTC